ncbi:MAG: asparagine synthase (glutamine-hydrolyzing) [Pyrinomonadaceae bacterium]
MCGIFGIYSKGHTPIGLRALLRSTTTLRHRGPDDEGYSFVNTRTGRTALCSGHDTTPSLNLPPIETLDGEIFDLAFGFRRLSILDLSPAGHQPMASADGTCWIVYNGEIYNYLELRTELADHGFGFHTGTDTEVILAAYRHWGVDCLSHFNGMWAFAIWDSLKRCLFLARDRFGIKPLYYTNDGKRFVFASEIKALLDSDKASRQVNPNRLYDYLRFGLTDHSEETLFTSIHQLPPAHRLVISLDQPEELQINRYWHLDLDRKANLSFEEAATRLRELFLESIKLHLRSDVPIGAALSGGIDSSAIVTSMRLLQPDLGIHTFSYIADDSTISEERWVDMAGLAANSSVHKVQPCATSLADELDNLIQTQDEPFGSTSIYAQYRVFHLAHKSGIKVMLDGQGADEMLAGYPWYLVARVASLLRQGRLMAAGQLSRQAAHLPGIAASRLLVSAGGSLLPANLQRLAERATGNGLAPPWLNNNWFMKHGVDPKHALKGVAGNDLRSQLRESLMVNSLPMLLRYEDRNSMAHSIESRVPFLTAPLAEFIITLPDEFIIAPDGTSKSVFRRAMRGIVPDAILDRTDKVGFATPERRWLTALRPWVEDVLSSSTAKGMPALNLKAVRQQWDSQLNGHSFDFKFWRWLNVIRWAELLGVNF